MILVTGATGTVGRRVVHELRRRRVPVRAVSRAPESAGLPAEVSIVAADLERADTLEPAFEDVERVFLVCSGPRRVEQDANVVDAARRAGVRQIVRLSALTVSDPATDDLITRWHRAGEQLLADSPLEWAALRAGAFMSNALAWVVPIRHQSKVFAPFGDVRTAAIDPQDIADAAANILTDDGQSGRVYELTGPELISAAEEVSVLSEVLGRELELIDVAPDAARDRMLAAGLNPDIADAVLSTQANAGRGPGATVTPTVQKLTGHAARTFKEWAGANAERFC